MAEQKAIDDLTVAEIHAELEQLKDVKSQRAGEMRQEFRRELMARENRTRSGCCDYCGRRLGSEPACKYPDRHGMEKAAA